MKRIAVLLALLLSPGCVLSRTYVNAPLDPEAVAQLAPGTSTATDVVSLLGAPNEVVQLGRRSAYRYEHVQEKTAGVLLLIVGLVNSDTQADRTWVFFDEANVLTHVGTTLQVNEAEYAMPWSSYKE